jgi:hypothetical protein
VQLYPARRAKKLAQRAESGTNSDASTGRSITSMASHTTRETGNSAIMTPRSTTGIAYAHAQRARRQQQRAAGGRHVERGFGGALVGGLQRGHP